MLRVQAGSIAGSVRSEDGKTIPNATVVAARRFTSVTTKTPALTFTSADRHGQYQFDNLVQGSYVICAQVAWMPYLDPCAWDTVIPAWNLEAVQRAVVNITLRKGVFLHIRVDDPTAAVKNQKAKVPGPVYSFHVLDRRGQRQLLQLVAQDAGGENLRTIVPPDTDVGLVANPGQIALYDADGKAVAAAQNPTMQSPVQGPLAQNPVAPNPPYTIRIAAAANEKTLRFTAKDAGK